MRGRLLKGALTVMGAVALSTLGIFASDVLDGIDRDLVGLSGLSKDGICRAGMALATIDGRTLCVDIYEASPSSLCPQSDPENILESESNAGAANCYAASVEDAVPWRYISLPQAQRMCANAGKRLPSSDEWYRIALGTDPATCVIDSREQEMTGSGSCVSEVGAHDMVGNVWEWVDEDVVGSEFRGRALPEEGYVTSVDASGVAVTSGEGPDDLYGKDYFWSESEGVFGMIRGGFYGSRDDAGLYAINASIPTSFASQGVGFRCVEDLF